MRRDLWRPFRRSKPVALDRETGESDKIVLANVHGQEEDAPSEFNTAWDDISGLAVLAGEFVTTTAEGSSHPALEPASRLLQQVRERVGMDVVFISQFVDGRRVVRRAAADPDDAHGVSAGHADPLEATSCLRVLDGRLPQAMRDARENPESARLPVTHAHDIRAHATAPIRTSDGRVHGTVCAFAHQPRLRLEDALAVLQSVARALTKALERLESGG